MVALQVKASHGNTHSCIGESVLLMSCRDLYDIHQILHRIICAMFHARNDRGHTSIFEL